jgi:hypothetical protein
MFYKDFTRNSFKTKDLAEISSQVLDSRRPRGEGVGLNYRSLRFKLGF